MLLLECYCVVVLFPPLMTHMLSCQETRCSEYNLPPELKNETIPILQEVESLYILFVKSSLTLKSYVDIALCCLGGCI